MTQRCPDQGTQMETYTGAQFINSRALTLSGSGCGLVKSARRKFELNSEGEA